MMVPVSALSSSSLACGFCLCRRQKVTDSCMSVGGVSAINSGRVDSGFLVQ